ncbi:MAG: leucine-rich repeat domain-containing protein [Prevotella sp.]|jgi:hypothetical protein|nr:leucine-rich repeat domain-containing protein [Prevotella sp.]
MKTSFFKTTVFAAAILALFSCSQDEQFGGSETGKKVSFQISTAIPAGLRTYASSNGGGATNVDAGNYDLRYILEVWTKETPARLAYRGYNIVADNFDSTGVTFNLNLLALEYDFVFWADFVEERVAGDTYGVSLSEDKSAWTAARDADLWYKTSDGKTWEEIEEDPTADAGLKAITLLDGAGAVATEYPAINDEARDAYTAALSIDLRTSDNSKTVTLYRPFGKFRLVTTDKVDGFLNGSFPDNAVLTYTNASLPSGFNALDGSVSGTLPPAATGYAITKFATENVVVGGDTYTDARVVAFDYVFAATGQVVGFDIEASNGATSIATRSFSNIPIVANKLTTIIGKLFTKEADEEIIVGDEFGGETEIDYEDLQAIGTTFVESGITYKITAYNEVQVGTGDYADANTTASGALIIPDNVTNPDNSKTYKVTAVARGAFYQNTNITSVTIGSNVQTIGISAFHHTGLTTLSIPDNVTEILSMAFHNCENLTTVVIGDGVTEIGIPYGGVFSNCYNLISLTLGNSVTNIGPDFINYFDFYPPFMDPSGHEITITSKTSTPPTIASTTFNSAAIDDLRHITLSVPSAALVSYQASDWRTYITKITTY